MTVGILKIFLFIEDSCSLKDKRMVLHSLKAKLRNNFNVAITQIDDEDKWQRATLAIVGIEKNNRAISRILSGVINFLDNFDKARLIDYNIELI